MAVRGSLAVVLLVIASVGIVGPAMADGSCFAEASNPTLNSLGEVHAKTYFECSLPHDKNENTAQLKYSSSGAAGTFSTIKQYTETTYNDDGELTGTSESVCKKGTGYYKTKGSAKIYDNGNLVHSPSDDSAAVYLKCEV